MLVSKLSMMKLYIDKQGVNDSILIVNKEGKIYRLYAPFKVICRYPINGIKSNTLVYVEAVYGTTKGEIIYTIFKKPFPHSHFEVIIRF